MIGRAQCDFGGSRPSVRQSSWTVWSKVPGTHAASATYGYPYPAAGDCNEATLGGGCVGDSRGFLQGQCTSWVAFRLASRNGVDGVESLADGGRLLYPSNVYKSYPFSWLEDGEYHRLTNWLQQLTAHDLSKVDLADVPTLDDWFDRLEAVTNLRLCHSSSTTGKLSFVPRGVDEWVRRTRTLPFGAEAATIPPLRSAATEPI